MPLSARCLLVALMLATPAVALADAVVVTRAMTASTILEAFIEEDELRLELEIGEQDLGALSSLAEAARAAKSFPVAIPRQAELSITADGERLSGRIESLEQRKRVERDEVSGEPLPTQSSETTLFISLRYPLSGQPRVLVLQPPIQDGYSAANIGFVIYHQGIAVNDFRYLAADERLLLDWSDPFYSRFERRALKRKFDSPMNVFLYVEPFEVRKELVLRPLDLARFAELDIRAHEPIPAEKREALLAEIAEFLATRAPVTIDGRRTAPILDRIHFLKRGLRMTRVVSPDEPVDGTNAVIGAIFVYPVDGLPKDVRLDWDLFDERVQRVPGAATDEAGPMPYFLTPDDNQLHWVNYLKRTSLPGELEVRSPQSSLAVSLFFAIALFVALALLLVAFRRRSWALFAAALLLPVAGWFAPSPALRIPVPTEVRTPSGAEAAPTIHALLYNIYRALDFRDEELVFDRLAQSLSGDVLERVYLEMRKGLRLENQGGARVRVREIDLLELNPQPSEEPGALRYRAKWNATGSVGHWGHTHMRTNQYDAELTLASVDERWRITDVKMLEEQRLGPEPAR